MTVLVCFWPNPSLGTTSKELWASIGHQDPVLRPGRVGATRLLDLLRAAGTDGQADDYRHKQLADVADDVANVRCYGVLDGRTRIASATPNPAGLASHEHDTPIAHVSSVSPISISKSLVIKDDACQAFRAHTYISAADGVNARNQGAQGSSLVSAGAGGIQPSNSRQPRSSTASSPRSRLCHHEQVLVSRRP